MARGLIWTAEAVQEITGGTPIGTNNWQAENISTDSRSLQSGDLFIALRGENFHGESFLATAKERGAVAAIVQEPCDIDLPQLVVRDSKEALSELAHVRRHQCQARVIGLTGSNGKTSTKEMLARILATKGNTLATLGNLNNNIGVPLTLLRLCPEHCFAVVEMGANHQGEIANLVEIAKPDIVMITNISDAHLEGFGVLKNVVEAKEEIYTGSHGKMVINNDLVWAQGWQKKYQHREIKTFSLCGNGDIIAPFVGVDGSEFTLEIAAEQAQISWQLKGKHNVENALAACAAASFFGVSLTEMARALNGLKLKQSRLSAFNVKQHCIYDDTYNANPASFRAGIDVVAATNNSVVIAGAMGELGARSDELHRQVGEYAKEVGIKRFWTLNAPAYGGEDFSSMKELARALNELLAQTPAQTILVKGSRSAKMERLFVQADLDRFRQI